MLVSKTSLVVKSLKNASQVLKIWLLLRLGYLIIRNLASNNLEIEIVWNLFSIDVKFLHKVFMHSKPIWSTYK
jgi:hypothetical protein